MPLIDHIDGVNRDIYLSADTVGASIHPIDIYKEMRALRRTNESLRKFNLFLEAKGKDSKGSGKFTERFVRCLEGTRIVPYDTSHDLTVTGTIITDDGQEGNACFDRSPLAPTTTVNINYFPPQVEIIEVVVGGGGGGVTKQDVVDAITEEGVSKLTRQDIADVLGLENISTVTQQDIINAIAARWDELI